jgi:hypothetical protein
VTDAVVVGSQPDRRRWAWYVNIANQAIWTVYALVTEQWGFLVGVAVYTWVFVGNAIRWTREHHAETAQSAGQ